MIPMPADVRVWLAVGRTDMRRGMNGLALQVQEALQRDPHAGDLFVFRGARGDLIKILWHDGLGLSLYAKRLERGRFVWPPDVTGAVAGGQPKRPEESALTISSAQLAYLLSGIDWRNPVQTFRPQRAG
jgi:transposase